MAGFTIRVGFTGTQRGMTGPQKTAFKHLLTFLHRHNAIVEFHEGDCKGADDEATTIVREEFPNCQIFVHPPNSDAKRAFTARDGDIVFPPKPHIERNRDIVNMTDITVGTPKDFVKPKDFRGQGTWSTIHFSETKALHITFRILPNGLVEGGSVEFPWTNELSSMKSV